MTTQTQQPWKPTCWVGGCAVTMANRGGVEVIVDWIDIGNAEIQFLSDDSRAKYAATKASAAILRSMRK